ncbi:BZ3500_MvSof-1268-A1-R1_Chr3-3g06388 [Microbotryum saponariae]|uniref:BZ3500_MvSof-1268-A1-R1_Chr3-3g06388 protein n=1 Tax=Microbotryum saponariae TaxID=289078 RepID=A0A2X0M5A9_9BASI|nr:BZ3500_MvSof-1268-A1-R1_Chr3-3g06388 [Microbotryum saponariae]SDA04355.1 BZ3501_MvSof-1269-A2-R1_Chr3-2g06075 [Microbotryum saponariae]
MSESEGFVLQTAPFDARFPNANQSRACLQNYIDHYRCVNKKGEDFEPCKQASCAIGRARRAIAPRSSCFRPAPQDDPTSSASVTC